MEAWNINITPYTLIGLICAFIVPIVIRTKKDIELLLIVWSVFVIIFTIKGYWQKSHGFSSKDLYFLFSMGGARTHIIWSGIRYFSCFTDAANYGVHCAMATVVFTISAFFVDSKWKRIYFLRALRSGNLRNQSSHGSYHGRNADDNHFGQKLESAVGRHLCLYRSFLFFLFH